MNEWVHDTISAKETTKLVEVNCKGVPLRVFCSTIDTWTEALASTEKPSSGPSILIPEISPGHRK